MKKIIFIIALALSSLLVSGQAWPAPDPVPQGGSRQEIRENGNWNILVNDDQETRLGVLETAPQYFKRVSTTLFPFYDGDNLAIDDIIPNLTSTIYVNSIGMGIGKIFRRNYDTNYFTFTDNDEIITYIGGNPVWNVASLNVTLLGSRPLILAGGGGSIRFTDANTQIYENGGDLTFQSNATILTLDELAAATVYNAGSGLELSGSTFNWNGELTENIITVEQVQTTSDIVRLQATHTVNYKAARIEFTGGVLQLKGYDNDQYNTGSARSSFALNGSSISMSYIPYIGSNRSFTVNSAGLTITDGLGSIGLVGAAYYGGTAGENAYAQQKYVDDAVVAANTSTELDYTSCIYNETTDIVIEAVSTNSSYKLHYGATRDVGTVTFQGGNIEVVYDAVSDNVYYYSDYPDSNPPGDADIGMTIEADFTGGYIRLNIIVDNSFSNNLFFNYKIISKIHE